jgi:hypothetical protein
MQLSPRQFQRQTLLECVRHQAAAVVYGAAGVASNFSNHTWGLAIGL